MVGGSVYGVTYACLMGKVCNDGLGWFLLPPFIQCLDLSRSNVRSFFMDAGGLFRGECNAGIKRA